MADSFPDFNQIRGQFGLFKYQPITQNKSGFPVVYRSLNEKPIRFLLQRPREVVTAPFGISVYIGPNATAEEIQAKEQSKRKDFSFNTTNPELLDFFQALENHTIDMAIQNKQSWFKKDFSDTQIRDKFSSFVATDPKYGSIVRTKVNCTGKYAVKILEMVNEDGRWIAKKRQVSDFEKKSCQCRIAVEAGTVWFQHTKSFGLTLVATHILVYPGGQDVEMPFSFAEGEAPLEITNQESKITKTEGTQAQNAPKEENKTSNSAEKTKEKEKSQAKEKEKSQEDDKSDEEEEEEEENFRKRSREEEPGSMLFAKTKK